MIFILHYFFFNSIFFLFIEKLNYIIIINIILVGITKIIINPFKLMKPNSNSIADEMKCATDKFIKK